MRPREAETRELVRPVEPDRCAGSSEVRFSGDFRWFQWISGKDPLNHEDP
jgi:hypothetical protein